MGDCPNCGANVRYTDSYLSTAKHSMNGFGFARAECIGTIEREGWSTTKTGERKWRVKYSNEPCGWSRGMKPNPIRVGTLAQRHVSESPVANEAHNPKPSGRLVLNDYRSGF